tara:strand:+ start:174 stop:560 length:387 start_codon:yes stop_codon:yes gene_type:complete
MAHYAKIEDGIVTQVIVAEQDFMDLGRLPGQWLQTSFNTRGGIHYATNSDRPDGGIALRMNYASIGGSYDSDRDAFIPIKPYASWLLDESTCTWEAPIPIPDDDGFPPSKSYYWDESIQNWVEDLVTD